MVTLKSVPLSAPSPKEQVIQRMKRAPRPDGMLQCNRCGSRTVMSMKNGVIIKDGRKTSGTVIEKDICADCYRKGVITSMLPGLKPVK